MTITNHEVTRKGFDMSEQARVSELLRRTYEGGAWHGSSLREALEGVDAATAANKPIAGAHSIWEITLHVSGWTDVVRRKLSGESLAEPDEGDFPAVEDTSEGAWRAARALLEERVTRLQAAIADLDDPNLENASVYETLHGVVDHQVYHTGQIAALRKA
jgi:uncharacterized damage-inducible protein DinB